MIRTLARRLLDRARARLTWHGECVCGCDFVDETRTRCRGRECPNYYRKPPPCPCGEVHPSPRRKDRPARSGR